MADTSVAPASYTDGRPGPARAEDAEPNPSSRSLRGLDGLNFLMADVRDGLGPYLSIFLKGSQHWGAGQIGVVMAVGSIAAAVCQVPAGLLVDGLRIKRALVAASGLLIAASCLLIAYVPTLPSVIAAQAILGAASAVIPPALAALSLGIVGRRLLPARISRNEGFNHGGNFVAASLAGGLGQYVGFNWIFYLVCIFAVASAAVCRLIDRRDIDDDLARGGEAESADGSRAALPFRDLLRRRDLLVFLASVVLFHFGNAAMLPLAGQVLAQKHPGSDAISLSACIIAAQFVMIGVAWAVGRAMQAGFGRKTIFLVALAVLPIRGVLFTVVDFPAGVVAIQLLDGVAAGIFGVISVIIAADLMRGTGRFNLAQGLVALSVGVGAGLSNLVSGFVVQAFGYPSGFLTLAAIAVCALVFFLLFMPETRPDDRDQASASASPRRCAGTES
jgi:predicted MFS family arabinose efflux permease